MGPLVCPVMSQLALTPRFGNVPSQRKRASLFPSGGCFLSEGFKFSNFLWLCAPPPKKPIIKVEENEEISNIIEISLHFIQQLREHL